MVSHTALLYAVLCVQVRNRLQCGDRLRQRNFKRRSGSGGKYLGFLHAGGSDYSLNILKNAGVDLNTPQPVTVTLQKFAAKLKELKALLGK